MSDTQSESSKTFNRVEHNDDGAAKRVILRYQNPNDALWYNYAPPFTPGVEYDYLDVQQTSSTVDTYVFKNGGAAGTTIRTITVTYTSSTKSDIDYVSWA